MCFGAWSMEECDALLHNPSPTHSVPTMPTTAEDRTLLRASEWLSEASGVPLTAGLAPWADAVRRSAVRARLAHALSDSDGNRAHAARELGVSAVRLTQLLNGYRGEPGYPDLVKRFPAVAGNPAHRVAREKPTKQGARKKKKE